jgi:tryptophan 2,3-dioxygenase
MATTSKTYAEYLRLPQLLGLQGGWEANDDAVSEDELHFIVVHQVFELWFKLVLRELRMARGRMSAQFVPDKDIPYVVRHLRRVNAVLKIAVNYFDALETLTPLDFIAFRKKLEPASGAQSFQMREIEFLMGLEQSERQRHGHSIDPTDDIIRLAKGSPSEGMVLQALETARQELKEGRSLRAALHEWLYRTPIRDSCPSDSNDDEIVTGFLDEYRIALERFDKRLLGAFNAFISASDAPEAAPRPLVPKLELGNERSDAPGAHVEAEHATPPAGVKPRRSRASRIRAALLFIESYREADFLTWPNLLLDSVVEMEEELILWRFRHVRMVERTIGRRVGTGGSPGVAYLDQTTEYRIFNEFWAVRSVLIPPEFLPALRS